MWQDEEEEGENEEEGEKKEEVDVAQLEEEAGTKEKGDGVLEDLWLCVMIIILLLLLILPSQMGMCEVEIDEPPSGVAQQGVPHEPHKQRSLQWRQHPVIPLEQGL